MILTAANFHDWFRELHGVEPFPWQRRLLDDVVQGGVWPRHMGLPTASGKTAVMDVALYALVLEAQAHLESSQQRGPRTPEGSPDSARNGSASGRSAPEPDASPQVSPSGGVRRMPLRIVFIVDRRVVADAAYERACEVARKLKDATGGVLAQAADILTRCFGVSVPLHVALLRGGIYREDRWVRHPAQPTIVCSTVDQVGSRLLFRGYGVSPRTWPIHAGLLAHDCLLILDEAHVSQAFEQTLRQIEALRDVARPRVPLRLPWHVVSMSATLRSPGSSSAQGAFALNDDDLDHPVLAPRLTRPKPIELVELSGNKDAHVAKEIANQVEACIEAGETRVLVVVNLVSTARATFDALDKLATKRARRWGTRPDVVLLTGRARPVERDRLVRSLRPRIFAGWRRIEAAQREDKPVIVVATQCVEVGADLDADVLITEACALDAFIQRLGRLNRLGERDSARCVVIGRKWHHRPTTKGGDPVYGSAAGATWKWLAGLAGPKKNRRPVDGAASALAGNFPPALEPLRSPAASAPTLFPAYVDLWAQTAPPPVHDPAPELFLHGVERRVAEVQIVWRADLGDDPDTWVQTLALCPPVVGEAITLRLSALRRWLAGETAKGQADVALGDDEASADGQTSHQRSPRRVRPVLRWRGPDDSAVVRDPAELRPGDTVVVPASYGGCDSFGWNPTFTTPVEDVADAARAAARRAPVVRLHPAILGPGAAEALARAASWDTSQPPADEDELDERDAAVAEAIEMLRSYEPGSHLAAPSLGLWADWVQHASGSPRIEPHPSGRGFVLIWRSGLAGDGRDFSDEDDTSLAVPERLPLSQHLADVGLAARRVVGAIGLPSDLANMVELAATLHDLGKLDPRFQAWMFGGDAASALAEGPVAKSPRIVPNSGQSHQARRIAEYPRGYRHEALSDALVASASPNLLDRVADRDLVRHLIAAHHGWARPFFPYFVDEHPRIVSGTISCANLGIGALSVSRPTSVDASDVGSEATQRFFDLLDRYGWWGLAFLEACVRLADWEASARPGASASPTNSRPTAQAEQRV